jgi:transcriptional regulator with XRE-family HTH domain
MATLGATLRAERETQRMTQRDLARKAGISRATVISVEAGGRTDVATILAMTSALNLELNLEPQRARASASDAFRASSNYDAHILDGTVEL